MTDNEKLEQMFIILRDGIRANCSQDMMLACAHIAEHVIGKLGDIARELEGINGAFGDEGAFLNVFVHSAEKDE